MSTPETCVNNMIKHFKYHVADDNSIRYKLKIFGGGLTCAPTSNSKDIVHNILICYIYIKHLSVASWLDDKEYEHALKCCKLVSKYLDRYEKHLNRNDFARYIAQHIWQ